MLKLLVIIFKIPEVNAVFCAVSHPPQLIQSAQHLLQLRHFLPGSCCLAVSIQVLGQLCMVT